MHESIRLTSLATVGEIFQKRPAINRVILKQVGDSLWEVTQLDEDRPNNLRQIADQSGGKFAHERNVKRDFEVLSGYDIDRDERIKVLYRLSRTGEV